MSSLWTPDGERPVTRAADEPAGDAVDTNEPLRAAARELGIDLDSLTEAEKTELQNELTAMMKVRQEVGATPASEMLANHLMRLFDLATIYLEADPPAFSDAATVIEAFRAVIERLDSKLGEHQAMLTEAIAQLQMVFVQVKRASESAEAPDR